MSTVSFWDDGNVLESDSSDGGPTLWLKPTELYTVPCTVGRTAQNVKYSTIRLFKRGKGECLLMKAQTWREQPLTRR